MSNDLERAITSLRGDFLVAVQRGPPHVAAFCDRLNVLASQLNTALKAGLVSQQSGEQAYQSFAFVLAQAQRVLSLDETLEDTVRTFSPLDAPAAVPPESLLQQPPPSTCLPLYRYFLANICSPYPESDDKERLAEAVRASGWHDFDKKKCEDWFNRKRNQSGYVAIVHKYCNDDRETMRQFCHAALFRTETSKSRLPDGALEDIEDMRDYMQSQHDELLDESDSTWVDELATRLRAALDEEDSLDEGSSPDSPIDDDVDADDSDCSSEAASDWSDTDVEDEDEDDEPPHVVIGAKRKLVDSANLPPPVAPRPLFRSLSVASSDSSSSSLTACSLRSFSGCSAQSTASVEWDDDDTCDRPTKRRRTDSSGFNTDPTLSTGPSGAAATTTVLSTNPLFTAYQIKPKHDSGDLTRRIRSMKRSRYVALGVASQTRAISDAHLSSLSGLCSLDWALGEVALSDLDPESFTVDCTQTDEEEVEVDDPAVCSEHDNQQLTDDIPAWSKLQIYSILHMLLSTSSLPLPASLVQSTTYAFDVDPLAAANVIALEEILKLTPEALSAMFDAMNGLAPASTQETTVPVERTPAALSEDVALPFQAPVAVTDTVELAPDVGVSALDPPGPALDDSVTAAGTPVLSVDTSSAVLEGPVPTEGLPGSPELLLSPISSSSSDSEGDSPPALSDDSGSSSRSCSPGPDSEQVSLLMSPAVLSAEYSQVNEEPFAGKVSDPDRSQFEVEVGALPEITAADPSSCASELLERYLNDPMTWA